MCGYCHCLYVHNISSYYKEPIVELWEKLDDYLDCLIFPCNESVMDYIHIYVATELKSILCYFHLSSGIGDLIKLLCISFIVTMS